MNWKDKPTIINKWNKKDDYTMFVDENSPALSLKTIAERIKRGEEIPTSECIFTITGCILSLKEYVRFKINSSEIKNKYWQSGRWYYMKTNTWKRVCFHSREIRHRERAFQEIENYDNFLNDLSNLIAKTDFKIISVSIDLRDFIYKSPEEGIYEIAFKFLLERFVYFLKGNLSGCLILESRGKKENKKLLQHINQIIFNEGTEFITKECLEQKISGVFFDPKFNDDGLMTYPGLELADLCSYPIHKYIKLGIRDQAFDVIECKFVKYPNYLNKGLKTFPKKIEAYIKYPSTDRENDPDEEETSSLTKC